MTIRNHSANRSLRTARLLAALAAAFATAGSVDPAPALQLPPGFVAESLPFVFDVPTAIAFLPGGGLLVAEKGGIVYVVRGGQRSSMWVHEEEVLNTDDRGLLAVAVDPEFATNRRLYFLLTVDPDSNGVELDNYDDAFGRLVRYQVSAADPDVVDESSRSVLIGATWGEGFPSGSGTHTIGALEWGADGSLIVSAGDGAHFEQMDAGGLDPGMFGPTRTDPAEDIGAFRAQDLGSLDGKLLRVSPENGLGYPSNPFYDGNAASSRSRVWSYGLRNPFRVARRPGTGSSNAAAGDPGTFYVGDVGWHTWEEIDVVRTAGANFGWPCYEGWNSSDEYQAAAPTHHGCGTIGTPQNPSPATGPITTFHHTEASMSVPAGTRGGVIAGGVFYTGSGYPSSYQGAYFFGDYSRGWIKAMKVNDQDQVIGLFDFATEADGPVCFATDPANGDLYYVSIWTGEIRHIRYVGTAAAPGEPSERFALSAPRPNPSRGAAALSLEMPEAAEVSIAVFDVSGRELWAAPERELPPGRHELSWPGVRSSGEPVGAGVYLLRVQAGANAWTRRVAVIR